MKKLPYSFVSLIQGIIAIFFITNCALANPKTELRCGWFDNSSPGNASLTDRDGEWTIAMQGQYEAKGNWPKFKPSEWVQSGTGSYGHGCACLKVTVNTETQEIIEIFKAKSKPLSDCRRDKKLQEP